MFVPLTGSERDTLAYLQDSNRETLPEISYSVKQVFSKYVEEAKEMPTLELKSRSPFHISPASIKQLEDKIANPSRKHKIISILAMAATVAAVAAGITALAVLAPAWLLFLVVAAPLIICGIGGLSVYIHDAFRLDKQNLKNDTATAKQFQINVDLFKEFLDKHGEALKEAIAKDLDVNLLDLDDSQVAEKAQLRAALTELRRAEAFYADLELRPGQKG
jgi:hypothetical protein